MRLARAHHYNFAHRALPYFAFQEPQELLGAMLSPAATAFLENLWERCAAPDARETYSAPKGLDLSIESRKGRLFFVVSMPEPSGMTECFFAAAVLMTDMDSVREGALPVFRYFTLELARDLTRTVLCEWEDKGTHVNYGDGPPAEIPAFIGAIEKIIGERSVPSAR